MSATAESSAGALPASSQGAVPALATVLLARIARVVRRRFETALGPLGLRQRQIVALSYLRGHGPTAQQRLAEQLCMDPSSLVCLLNSLEERDLVVRRRDRSDRRRGLVVLSSRGEDALGEVDPALARVEEAILADLDIGERELLRGLLARITAGELDWELGAGDP